MRGYFGIGIYHPKHEVNVGGLWRHAQLYGASFIFTVGRRYEKREASDTGNARRHVPLLHYFTFEELIDNNPHGSPVIAVEQTAGSFDLPTFCHPERATYLLGAEDHGLPERVLERCHYRLEIPSPQEWSMNVSHAGTLVVYDRYIKGTKRGEG